MVNSQEIERSVVRKVLRRLAPFLALLYVFNLMDRGNVSIAAKSLQADLKFTDATYAMGFGIFFIGYFLFEIPSNLIMERVGARRWIARIMLTWGLVSTCMTFVHTETMFYVLRFLLGVAEAGFFPGIILYFTYWVPSSSRAQVMARFLALTSVVGLFGAPLGALLLKMNGIGGLKGWQWLFLLEGMPSILLAFLVWFVLPDTPKTARWLQPEEKVWIETVLAAEAKSDRRIEHLSLRVALSDPRILMMCAIFIITSTGLNLIGAFAPKIMIQRSGNIWSGEYAALLGFIPALVGAISMTLAAVHSDRTGKRKLHVTVGYFIGGLGFLVCAIAPSAWWVVVGLSINTLGERAAAGSYFALTTNLLGVRAAAGGIALINSVGNLGGFIGPNLMGWFSKQSGGDYTTGMYVAFVLMVIGAVLCTLLRGHPKEEGTASSPTRVAPERA